MDEITRSRWSKCASRRPPRKKCGRENRERTGTPPCAISVPQAIFLPRFHISY
jgi:hypothetical protein